jgi:hypothetical protein
MSELTVLLAYVNVCEACAGQLDMCFAAWGVYKCWQPCHK